MIPAAVEGGERAPGEGFLVLWLGGPGAWEPRVHALLDAAGVRVEDSGLDVLVERASQRAPDLVVLTGAAGSAPRGVVARLSERHPASSVPVVAIGPPESARPKPKSRYGLVATLDREAAPDVLAKQLVQLLRGLSRRPAKWRIKASRADIPAIAERFAKNARSGLLAARGAGAIAFDERAGVAPPPEVLVTALGRDVDHLTFHERPPGRIRILEEPARADPTAPPLAGARALVLDATVARATALAAWIEAAGGQARALPLDRAAIAGAKALDPTIVVVSAHGLASEASEPLWTEPRLVDASLLVLSDGAFDAPPALLLEPIADLCGVELGLAARLAREEAVAERLETLGAARWMKVLGRVPHDVTLRVYAAAGRGRIDLSRGRVKGAAFRPSDSRMAMIEGRSAVDALLALPFGRILAGPPDGVARLEGTRGLRKTSVIGQYGETPAEGMRRAPATARPKGLVAEEVVLHTPDRLPRGAEAAPSSPPRPVTTRPPPARPSAAPIDDLADDDFEMPTRNYTADAMAELQAELRSAAMVSEAPAPARSRSSSPPPAKPSSDPPPPRPRSDPPPARISSRPPPGPAPIAALPEPLVSPLPPPAPSAPKGPAANTWWFAAGIALAVAAAAYAGWQLSVETPTVTPAVPAPRPEARPAPIAPPIAPPTPAPTPAPAPEVAPEEPAPEPEEAGAERAVEPGEIRLPPPDATADDLVERSAEAARRFAFAESEMHARQALAIAPHHPTAAYRLSVALFRQQRHDEALEWAQRAAEWDPDDPRPRSLQGDLYMRVGRFETAADAYRAALAVERNYGPAVRALERLRERGVE